MIRFRNCSFKYFDIHSLPRDCFENSLLVTLNIEAEEIDSRSIQR